jgi:uncharacterized membrane protein
MAAWWVVLFILILAVLGMIVVVLTARHRDDPEDDDLEVLPRNFVEERETARRGDLSEENRAWETASRARDRARRDQDPPA